MDTSECFQSSFGLGILAAPSATQCSEAINLTSDETFVPYVRPKALNAQSARLQPGFDDIQTFAIDPAGIAVFHARNAASHCADDPDHPE